MPIHEKYTLETLGQLAAELRQGMAKRAADGVGETSHPVMDASDGTRDTVEGARFQEHEKDVKESNPGVTVDEAPEAKAGDRQDELQANMGPQQSSTGEDPSVEDDYKSTKDDPGTSHPMKADDGEKYAAEIATWSTDRLIAEFTKRGNQVLAEHVVATKAAAAKATPAKATVKAAGATQPASDVAKAAAAGYAAATAGGLGSDARPVKDFVFATVKEASDMADDTATFLHAWARKMAEDEGNEEKREEKEEGGEAPPEHGGEGGGAPSGGDMIAELGGGGGGEVPPPGAGGPEPSPEELQHGMAGAVDDLHLDPALIQQLIALLQGQAGGGAPPMGGGAPPMGGGAPPMGGDPMGGPPPGGDPLGGAGPKIAAAIKLAYDRSVAYRRSGKYVMGPPKTAREDFIRRGMREYLSDVITAAESKRNKK